MNAMGQGGQGRPSRQQLLADVLAGTRRREDDEVAFASEDPSFVRMLDDLLAVQAQLDRVAAIEQAALAGPATALDVRIEAAALARLRQAPVSPRRLAGPWRTILALAALLLLGASALLLWLRPAPVDQVLGGSIVVTVDPDYAELHMDRGPGALWYLVRVLDEHGKQIDSSDLLSTNHWTPNQANYPSSVVFEVRLVDFAKEGKVVARVEVDRSGTRSTSGR